MAYLPVSIACADIILQITVGTEHGLRHQLGNASFLCVFVNTLILVIAFASIPRVDVLIVMNMFY